MSVVGVRFSSFLSWPHLDNYQNTGIGYALLSRFDLIFIMVDDHHRDNDLAQANFKLALVPASV